MYSPACSSPSGLSPSPSRSSSFGGTTAAMTVLSLRGSGSSEQEPSTQPAAGREASSCVDWLGWPCCAVTCSGVVPDCVRASVRSGWAWATACSWPCWSGTGGWRRCPCARRRWWRRTRRRRPAAWSGSQSAARCPRQRRTPGRPATGRRRCRRARWLPGWRPGPGSGPGPAAGPPSRPRGRLPAGGRRGSLAPCRGGSWECRHRVPPPLGSVAVSQRHSAWPATVSRLRSRARTVTRL
jgi:hypothetical protein